MHGVAIADHDTTAGWGEATEASEEIGLPLLLGTEITAVDEDVSVHMLAFQYDPSNEHISSMFANTRAARYIVRNAWLSGCRRIFRLRGTMCSPK